MVLLAGCGHASANPRSDGDTPSSTGVSPSNRGESEAPAVIHSVAVGHNYVRLPVPSADLTSSHRVDGDTIVALADQGAFTGEVYPVISTDDGGAWVINGPRFERSGVAGGSGGLVNHITASASHAQLAWGRFGHNVWTRAPASRHWRVTIIDSVRRAWTVGDQLFVSAGYLHRPRVEYVSIDDGVSWHPLQTGPR